VPNRPPISGSAEVLVVEDDDDLRELLVECLVSAGHSTQPARNGKEALAMLAGNRLIPNLIILDLHMPVMGGRELLELMRSYKRLVDIPVLIVTGREPGELTEYPAVTYLRKPFELSVLLAVVERLLRAHTPQVE
jgi:CheY-like chemotaxis protein